MEENASVIEFCPKCGANMVIRTTKRGENAGKQFYGCFNYPNCRAMVEIERDNI